LTLLLCLSAYADLFGRGEATGVVIRSWYSGERVVFSLNISDQKNDEGPTLGNPNVFVYNGADKSEITEGDTLKLFYDSSDSDGIIVNRIEFIENKPGSVMRLEIPFSVIAAGVSVGALLIFSVLFYQIRKKRRQSV
jgi:hypothetical protein